MNEILLGLALLNALFSNWLATRCVFSCLVFGPDLGRLLRRAHLTLPLSFAWASTPFLLFPWAVVCPTRSPESVYRPPGQPPVGVVNGAGEPFQIGFCFDSPQCGKDHPPPSLTD